MPAVIFTALLSIPFLYFPFECSKTRVHIKLNELAWEILNNISAPEKD
jgi:hypothetical protein